MSKPKLGFDWRTINLLVALEQQSPDIANGVHTNRSEQDIGAGDQVQTKLLKHKKIGKICEWGGQTKKFGGISWISFDLNFKTNKSLWITL